MVKNSLTSLSGNGIKLLTFFPLDLNSKKRQLSTIPHYNPKNKTVNQIALEHVYFELTV